MITETIAGDLVAMLADARAAGRALWVAHGCNCYCTHGAGLAKQLRRFPEVLQADLDHGPPGDRGKLGGYAVAAVGSCRVVNMFTQHHYAPGRRQANYAAIGAAFLALNAQAAATGAPDRLYIPKIGAGLAGGDWAIIRQLIDDATPDLPVTLVEYAP